MAANNILILTGAGISAESGLGTFRDKDGLWTQYDLEEVATPEGFARNPELVYQFYNARRSNCRGAAPNAAHTALARLQAALPGQVTIVTQNVDDLHERGGSTDVIHMHGELMSCLCVACAARSAWAQNLSGEDACPNCASATLRPDVVWFGEIPYHMERIEQALIQADLFVSIGTSGEVYPAAGFVSAAQARGIETVELNLEPSAAPHVFDSVQYGPATLIVPNWCDMIVQKYR